MLKLDDMTGGFADLDEDARKRAAARLDNLTKPKGSLGALEEMVKCLAAIYGTDELKIGKKTIFVMAGDHGVAEEGVSAFPSEVTPQMVLNFLGGGAAINVLARHVGADVKVVDIGVAGELETGGLISRKVKPGTDNMTKGPAMTKEEALEAIKVGMELAMAEVEAGAKLLGTGDMGIGNTTSSSAIAAVLTGSSLDEAIGRGTGIGDGALKVKRDAIRRAIELNRPDPTDPLDVLSKVGGLEIAGITGLILGSAKAKVPVVIDGFISSAAALVAAKISKKSTGYMIASHQSVEPGHLKVLSELGLKPVLMMDMRLGEGTGAALAMGLIDGAIKIYNEMATFDGAGVSKEL
ncbi:MAG: nicotinate-nucleotide--dimethylbenzimidazole phosphoribosyltransferase [Actinomycetota bacterium]|nr:nicotinate-nucleotide--dimethylbenzimidazole phosphoribosyltransferase [Actinomycetota bacterium]